MVRKKTIKQLGSILGDILICGIIGLMFAGLCTYLYNNGIWLDEFIKAPNTIEDFNTIIIIIWLFIGVIVGSLRK